LKRRNSAQATLYVLPECSGECPVPEAMARVLNGQLGAHSCHNFADGSRAPVSDKGDQNPEITSGLVFAPLSGTRPRRFTGFRTRVGADEHRSYLLDTSGRQPRVSETGGRPALQ